MKSFLLIILFSCLAIVPSRGNPIPFSPIVRNYSALNYHAGSQNWAVAQDERGVMYFGNNKGLLQFDGSQWVLYPLPSGAVVRAVHIAANGRIYVGSFEEFGYFERDTFNRLVYHSLKQAVQNYNFHNDEIWTILEDKGKVIFQSFGSVFTYDGEHTTGYRTVGLPLNMFRVGSSIYSQFINRGLNLFTDTGFQPLLDRIMNDDVVACLPHPDGMLLLTRNNAGFIYSGTEVKPWRTECDEELKHRTINRAILTKDSSYVVGTLSNGVYAFDRQGKLLWKENAGNQLENNTVLGLYCDRDNNVWVALDYGIAYIQNNSSIYHYEPVHRKMGMVYDVLVRQDDAYIASNQGLYRLDAQGLDVLPGLDEQAWTVGEWGNQVICGHNKGTFQISGNRSLLLSSVKGAMCTREVQLQGERVLLQGTYTYLNLYKTGSDGEWHFSNSITDFHQMAKNLEVDHRGNIWVEHMRKGLYRVQLDPKLERVTDLRSYPSLSGASSGTCSLFKINGRVVFSDDDSFYTYDDVVDSIIPYQAMNEQLAGLKGVYSVNQMRGELYWFLSDQEAWLVQCTLTDFQVKGKIAFALFGNQPIEKGGRMVYDSRRNCSYLCLNNSIVRVVADSTGLYKRHESCALFVSGFTAINEDTGDRMSYPISAGNRIDADFNNIRISLAYPDYGNYHAVVRYKLEGLTDKWTEGLPAMKKEYTRLPFGDYCFKAEVLDVDGVVSLVEIPFTILRPWYLSYLAIGVYVLASLGALLLLLYVVYVYTRKKRDAVIERQQARHQAEIEQQEKKIMALEKEQLEADLRFKSKELSGVLMTNIAHQEFLTTMKEEVLQQKLSGQYTRKNLDKLLTMLNQNLVSDEDSWNVFQANFDRIHDNFFRHLKEQYPELTSGDLRLCALLRLNLPTKEIAKLMNISIRGVDAARYRLRKKLNLSADSSLTDFMLAFK